MKTVKRWITAYVTIAVAMLMMAAQATGQQPSVSVNVSAQIGSQPNTDGQISLNIKNDESGNQQTALEVRIYDRFWRTIALLEQTQISLPPGSHTRLIRLPPAKSFVVAEARWRIGTQPWRSALSPFRIRFEPDPPAYEQQVQIVFKTQEAAQRAVIAVAPLYNGYTWAVSSRWDDNNPQNWQIGRFLNDRGHKATWYLNGLGNWELTAEAARDLLRGGNSIGCHGLTHNWLIFANCNRIFEEVAAVRLQWEALADTSIISFVPPFTSQIGAPPVENSTIDIVRALDRSGYYHIANHAEQIPPAAGHFITSVILPHDGQPIPTADTIMPVREKESTFPLVCFSMHASAYTHQTSWEEWQQLEKELEDYGDKPSVWYCNQNQYAAYRYQILHSELVAVQRDGSTVGLSVRRPNLLDVNDAVPMTFQITGVAHDDVEQVTCNTARCAVSDRQTDGVLFHLYHDRDQALPWRIGLVDNRDNAQQLTQAHVDADFPDLPVLLRFADQSLTLTQALARAQDSCVLDHKIDQFLTLKPAGPQVVSPSIYYL